MVSSNAFTIAFTTSALARMLPCAVQYVPCLSPAHSVALGPVYAATLPCASMTANCRPYLVQSVGRGSGSPSQTFLITSAGLSPCRNSAIACGP